MTTPLNISNGDILLFRGTSFYSWLIKLVSRSVYSHAAVCVWIQTGVSRHLFIIEAITGVGVRLIPADRYLKECHKANVVVEWFHITDHRICGDTIADYCLSQCGRQYASFRQLWLSWSLIRRLLGLPTRDIDPKRFFCSELCTKAFARAGYYHDEHLKSYATDPGAVARFKCLTRMGMIRVADDK